MIDRNKQIRNIYYMIAYASRSMEKLQYIEKSEGMERFNNVSDLFSEILSEGVATQLKRGLYRKYISVNESLTTLKGKLDINGTIGHRLKREMRLSCDHDEYSANNIFNRILKTAMSALIYSGDVSDKMRNKLKKDLLFFSRIDYIEPSAIRWDALVFEKQNQSYRLLMFVCRLILDNMLYSESGKQNVKIALTDIDVNKFMDKIYEKFILNYYDYHYKNRGIKASAKQIQWRLESDDDEFLPAMQTDITLRYGGKTLIIDAKYYSHITVKRRDFDKRTYHSGNLYQIFTYVKNADVNDDKSVSGMLLYAKTDEDVIPENRDYKIAGNTVSVYTLDLNKDFADIASQLNKIADGFILSESA